MAFSSIGESQRIPGPAPSVPAVDKKAATMNLAMILPLFSQHPLRDYLGMGLLAAHLRRQGHRLDGIDLNEGFVDALLADSAALQRLVQSKKNAAKDSPYAVYFDRYVERIGAFADARALKQGGLYEYFFRNFVLSHCRAEHFHGPADVGKFAEAMAARPELDAFLTAQAQRITDGAYDAVLVGVPHAHLLTPGLIFAQKVKALRPGLPVIFGGSTITLLADGELDAYRDKGLLDYYVKYSGEQKTARLLDDLQHRPDRIDQRLLARKAYVAIDDQIQAYTPEICGGAVPVLYSRGCYWGKCTYCNYIALDAGRFSRKKAEILLDELAAFSGKPVRISLITEALTPHDARIIAEGILERRLKLLWGSFIRVNAKFDAKLFALLKKSGCIFACVGVESVNDRVLAFFNKGYKRQDVYRFFDEAKQAGYRFFQVNFIYGTPEASLSDELDNIAFISAFRDVIGNIAYFPLEITKNSHLGQNLSEYHIAIDPAGAINTVRVDVIPFVTRMRPKEKNLVERSYEIAAEYFSQRDIASAIQRLRGRPAAALPADAAVPFDHMGRRFLGSMRSPLIAEISPGLSRLLEKDVTATVGDVDPKDLVLLFEMKILNTESVFWEERIRT
jgi:hypothetical protein